MFVAARAPLLLGRSVVAPISKAAANHAGNSSCRAMSTSSLARRLAAQSSLLRLAAATGGGLVVVGVGGTQLYNSSNANANTTSANGITMGSITELLSLSKWWQATSAAMTNNNKTSCDASRDENERNDKVVREERDRQTCHSGPGKRVRIPLEDYLVNELPVMSLKEVQKCTSDKQMLVTYEGIVYDVTQFVHDHPGGAELIKTAAGLDLDHFFGNYTVHGDTEKAAHWLAPLAVGKLSPEEAEQSRIETTPEVHVQRRARILREKVSLVWYCLLFCVITFQNE